MRAVVVAVWPVIWGQVSFYSFARSERPSEYSAQTSGSGSSLIEIRKSTMGQYPPPWWPWAQFSGIWALAGDK